MSFCSSHKMLDLSISLLKEKTRNSGKEKRKLVEFETLKERDFRETPKGNYENQKQ